MRALLSAVLSAAAVAGATAPAAAQNFEGKVTVAFDGPMGTMTYLVKGGKAAATFTMPASSGMMAGKEARMIFDAAAGTTTMLIPMEMGGSKGMSIVFHADNVMAHAAEAHVAIKNLGTSQTIAGYHCDDYSITSDDGTMRMCATKALGAFVFPRSMRRTASENAPAGMAELMKQHLFPLQLTDSTGKAIIQVTSIVKGPVPDDAFVVPEGYRDMSNMMGGRGPGDR